jgi:hypothetical protein
MKNIHVTVIFAAFGVMAGLVFVVPFVFLNIIFFFRYRASLRNCSSANLLLL